MPSDSVALSSHPASPFLNQALTLWTERRRPIRRDIEQRDDGLAVALAELHDRWNQMRSFRRERWETFEQSDRLSETLWGERLSRIEDWQRTLKRLQDQCAEIDGTVSSMQWFDRAQDLGKRLAANLGTRIARHENAHTQLHEQLEQWLSALTAKEMELKELKQKAEDHAGPFLVSRGRKQPELDSLVENSIRDADLGSQLQNLRKAVAISLGRLYRASRQIESRARVNEAFFEIRRKQIAEDLKDIQNQYFGLREKVLADALLYESCRRKLRWVKEAVNALRCIEDVYKAPESTWKKFVSRF